MVLPAHAENGSCSGALICPDVLTRTTPAPLSKFPKRSQLPCVHAIDAAEGNATGLATTPFASTCTRAVSCVPDATTSPTPPLVSAAIPSQYDGVNGAISTRPPFPNDESSEPSSSKRASWQCVPALLSVANRRPPAAGAIPATFAFSGIFSMPPTPNAWTDAAPRASVCAGVAVMPDGKSISPTVSVTNCGAPT